MFARFSTVGGESGSADTARDPRGFALKFYTEEGNWDLVGNNTPIFFIRDPLKFSDFIRTQKRDPGTHLKPHWRRWDYWGRSPEAIHQVMFLYSDRGTPVSARFMNGSRFAYLLAVERGGRAILGQVPLQDPAGQQDVHGCRGCEDDRRGTGLFQRGPADRDPDEATFPKWTMFIQVMPEREADTYKIHPLRPDQGVAACRLSADRGRPRWS